MSTKIIYALQLIIFKGRKRFFRKCISVKLLIYRQVVNTKQIAMYFIRYFQAFTMIKKQAAI